MTRRTLNRVALAAGLVALRLAFAGRDGGGSLERTYESGTTRLTLHSGGTATYSVFDKDVDCFYAENDETISLKCLGRDPVNLTFRGDGSLVDPFASVMRVMKKVG